jgi:hypothetical protein
MATFEEAKQCPKCKQPGEEGKFIVSADRQSGSKTVQIFCRNNRCKWFNTPWTVTVKADGSVPDPQDHSRRPKTYTGFEDHDRIARQVQAAIEADEARAVEGGEIRYPKR